MIMQLKLQQSLLPINVEMPQVQLLTDCSCFQLCHGDKYALCKRCRMAGDDALNLDEALRDGDVSRAWSVWSSASETALADHISLRVVLCLIGVLSWVGVLSWFVQ